MSQLFSANGGGGRGWRFSLSQSKREAKAGRGERRQEGIFGLDKDTLIRFETILHRPLPAEGWVKSVSWCGRRASVYDRERHKQAGRKHHGGASHHPEWTWAIKITLEVPPGNLVAQGETLRLAKLEEQRPVCGLDLGWRLMEGYLRLGVVVDSEGHVIELRLPLVGTSTRHTRRHNLYSDFLGLMEMDSEIGGHVERVKEKVGPLLVPRPAGWGQMRQGGLVRLLRSLQEERRFPEVQLILRKWLALNDRLRSLRSALLSRLLGRRNDLYGCLAKWLVTRYAAIAWEKDLEIKIMAENKEKSPALKAADRYRQWAAIYKLRQALKNAARKYGGCELKDGGTEYSTLTCPECGEVLDRGSGNMYLRCPAGHLYEQDIGAAITLAQRAFDKESFSQEYGGFTQNGALRKTGLAQATESLGIPGSLRAVAVPIAHR